MKKFLLVCLIFVYTLNTFAQVENRLPKGFERGTLPANLKRQTLRVTSQAIPEYVYPVNTNQNRLYVHPETPGHILSTVITEEKIGYTYYDLQTTGSASNRIVKNADGSFSAVWAFSPNAAQTPLIFPSRGTGYNYFDGTTDWYFTPPQPGFTGGAGGDFPQTKTEPTANRTGFPNICVTASGKEMTIQHTGTEMSMNWRPTKGTGAWTFSTPWGTNNTDFWPKAIGGGGSNGETVHAIWQGSGSGTGIIIVQGQSGPIFYSRSTDGGLTWGINKYIIPLIDSNYYKGFGPDTYSIDCKGDTVAIAYGDRFTDVGLLKSVDNGTTWTKTIIRHFPIPFYECGMSTDTNGDLIEDVIPSNAGDPYVLIDKTGLCHVWYSLLSVYGPLCTSYYPTEDGLLYWNETMPVNNIALIAESQDFNGNGQIDLPHSTACDWNFGLYGGGFTTTPSAGVDDQNHIYVTYQAIDELTDTSFHQVHRHIYMIMSEDQGLTWSYPLDIVPDSNTVVHPGPVYGNGEYQEAVFASVARKVDQFVYVLYQRDSFPGTALASGGCDQTNNLGRASDIIFTKVEAATVGTHGPVAKSTALLAVENYPNPAKDFTDLNITLSKPADMVITVTDVMGKTVHTETVKSSTSANRIVRLNTSEWNSGVYFYSVTANGQKASNALVIQ